MKLSPKVRSGVQNPSLVWMLVPGFNDFEISEYGDLRKGDHYIAPQSKPGGDRKYYRIYSGGKVHSFYAHQLVALAFIGPKPFVDAEVCHNDGFIHNNHYSNLRYDSCLGNMADVLLHKLQQRDHSDLYVRSSDRLRADANGIMVEDELRKAQRHGRTRPQIRPSRPSKRQREMTLRVLHG